MLCLLALALSVPVWQARHLQLAAGRVQSCVVGIMTQPMALATALTFPGYLAVTRADGKAGSQEQELRREVSALLGKLEAQGRELEGLQHHQAQARKLTATLHSTTTALEKSQAELQETASALERTQHQLAEACVAVGLQSTLAFLWTVTGSAAAT